MALAWPCPPPPSPSCPRRGLTLWTGVGPEQQKTRYAAGFCMSPCDRATAQGQGRAGHSRAARGGCACLRDNTRHQYACAPPPPLRSVGPVGGAALHTTVPSRTRPCAAITPLIKAHARPLHQTGVGGGLQLLIEGGGGCRVWRMRGGRLAECDRQTLQTPQSCEVASGLSCPYSVMV